MKREAIQELIRWKSKPDRKPLLIRGARQVGKTWLMQEFGKSEYAKCAYLNFESMKPLQALFEQDFDLNRILTAIQIQTGVSVDADTLLIFDEIQEAPAAITSLKYFYENAPHIHLIAAGSLLGVALHAHTSFPVGKVEFLELYPLSFYEFLAAVNQQPLLDLLRTHDWVLISTFREKYIQLLREYYYIGGMPKVVMSYTDGKDFNAVRELQKEILTAYDQDFSKHAPNEIVPRIRMMWNSIPAQLAKENRKFIYGAMKPGARAREYELAMSWLVDCGLVHKLTRVAKPGMPLKAYEDTGAFKLFTVDVGLLGAMGDIDAKTIINGNAIFEEFKGALTEQYVMQQLVVQRDMAIFYWSSEGSQAELDFLVQLNGQVVPVEVKAEENLRAKSLRVFCQKFTPSLAVRTSMSDFRKEEWLTNIPLYAVSEIASLD